MKKKLYPAFSATFFSKLLFCTAVFTGSSLVSASDKLGLEPSSKIELRGRYQTDDDGKQTYYGFQYRMIGNGYLSLSDSGCVRVRGQLATGPKFNSNWDDTGVDLGSVKTDGDLNLNLRQAYIDTGCMNETVSLQAGAMALNTPGALGAKEDGWVDGARLGFNLDEVKNIKMTFTLGQVDQYNKPSVFDREHDDLNYVQITTSGQLAKRATAFLDYTNHDTNDKFRGGLQISVADLVKIVDSLNIEEMINNGQQQGVLGSASKKLGKWDVKAAVSDIKEKHDNKDTLTLPIEDFYGDGTNISFVATRSLDEDKHLTLQGRCRAGEAGTRCELRLAAKM